MTQEDKRSFVHLLEQLIGYHDNDLEIDDRYEQRDVVNRMIIEVSRFINNIRYCSRVSCQCSPESSIKKLYKDNEKTFTETKYALYPIPFKAIENIVENYTR